MLLTADPCSGGNAAVANNDLGWTWSYLNSTCSLLGVSYVLNLGTSALCQPFYGNTWARVTALSSGKYDADLYCTGSQCDVCLEHYTNITQGTCEQAQTSADSFVLLAYHMTQNVSFCSPLINHTCYCCPLSIVSESNSTFLGRFSFTPLKSLAQCGNESPPRSSKLSTGAIAGIAVRALFKHTVIST